MKLARLSFWLGLLMLAGPALCREAIIEVQFHGNYSISDEEMARLAGVSPGNPVSDASPEEIKQRLLRTRRFEWVQVNKRYRSLSNPEQVVLVIVVKEKPPLRTKFMFLPILTGSDDYGLTYGGRVTAVNLLGARERISFPATWGGIRRVAVESQFDLENPILSAAFAGTGVSRKENPHFKIGDLRREVWAGATRRFRQVQIDFNTGWTGVDFGPLEQDFISYGTAVALDTRQDVNLPRNAFYTGLGWERMQILNGGPHFNRYKLDLRGYRGLFGQAVLAGQVVYHVSDGRLPDYQRPFLGGSATLRGEEPGKFIGDNIVITSVELRLPLTSKLAVYHAGMDFFLDSGAVYNHGQSFGSADVKHGAGFGFFFLVAGFGIKVDFAHNLRDNFRVHFSTGFRF
jgi:outer membrane protein assembly factor BamA